MIGTGIISSLFAKQPPYVVVVARKYYTKPMSVLEQTYKASPVYWHIDDLMFNHLPVNGAMWILKNEMPSILSSTNEPLRVPLSIEHKKIGNDMRHMAHYLLAYQVSKITCKATIYEKTANVDEVSIIAGEQQVKITSTYPDYQNVSIQFDKPQNIPVYVSVSPNLDPLTDEHKVMLFMTSWKFE